MIAIDREKQEPPPLPGEVQSEDDIIGHHWYCGLTAPFEMQVKSRGTAVIVECISEETEHHILNVLFLPLFS